MGADRRAESICTDLGEHAKFVAAKTGLVLGPYFSAPKQAWIRRNVTTEGVVTTSDTWLLHQLTGEFVTDASTAASAVRWLEQLTFIDTAADLDRVAAGDSEGVYACPRWRGLPPRGGGPTRQQPSPE